MLVSEIVSEIILHCKTLILVFVTQSFLNQHLLQVCDFYDIILLQHLKSDLSVLDHSLCSSEELSGLLKETQDKETRQKA